MLVQGDAIMRASKKFGQSVLSSLDKLAANILSVQLK
jgi:hypothetical protein